MGITFDSRKKIFHLQAKDTSYLIQLIKSSYLVHLYWGRRIQKVHSTIWKSRPRMFSPNPDKDDRTFSLDVLPQEYPAYGNSDFRHPSFQVQLTNGSTISDLRYESHKIFKGKPKLHGLPATYVEDDDEAETLEIVLNDQVTGLKAILSYTVYESFAVITRSVRFINTGKDNLKLLRALSMSVDFHHSDFDLLHLSGAWSRERWVERRALKPGMQSIESRRGASSHQHNPFIALLSRDANEDQGEVYGFNLVYSGNFVAQAEVEQFGMTRVSLGINPFDFSWKLEPGQSFQTPEVVLVYSYNGLGEMSRTYHRLYRQRLIRGKYRDQVRPILMNNWEATYYDFSERQLISLGEAAKELGMELFVLDDGWFGRRDSDNSSLGDWSVHQEKLPHGLNHLARKINYMGLKFGLWIEPEMVSPDSDLYRKHPDWCLHVPCRGRTEGRNQLVLDLSREDVCDWVIDCVTNILSSVPIVYVKWDMNRHMTEIGSALLPAERQRETAHRYMLGLYRVLDAIVTAFPDVLFENCSGGGGRFDPGMLYYMPQTWTSDNTDAVERLKIQYGTSIVYPPIAMGAHVSDVPNHQVHRISPLTTRGIAAMSGNFGYEMDLTRLSDEEKHIVKHQVAQYKEIRKLVQFGDFFRLRNPFTENEAAWMFVSPDQTEAVVMYFKRLAIPNGPDDRLRLKGLKKYGVYHLLETGEVFGGDELMYVGLLLPPLEGDFQSVIWRFVLQNMERGQI